MFGHLFSSFLQEVLRESPGIKHLWEQGITAQRVTISKECSFRPAPFFTSQN